MGSPTGAAGGPPSPLPLPQYRSLPSPLNVLTSTPSVLAVLQLVARDMATLAVRDQVLLWDAAVVHTLPRQDRFT